jgi:predicted RNase H-like HicB family nuclease
MKKTFTATVVKEDDLFVAQCLEVDVASQGKTEAEAIENLQEALELHFEDPRATNLPHIHQVKVKLGVA